VALLLSKDALDDAKSPCRPMATTSAPIKFTPGEKAVRPSEAAVATIAARRVPKR
jgi:hypothetical protein